MTAGRALAIAGALALLAAGAWIARRPSAPPRSTAEGTPTPRFNPPAVSPAQTPPPLQNPETPAETTRLMDELAGLFRTATGWNEETQRRLAALETALLARGETAVPAVVARLDARRDPLPVREALFNVLRRLPGASAERRVALEARRGQDDSLRTMAIETLGTRTSDEALAALADVARSDAQLPARPLIVGARDPEAPSPELPDEDVFTPRMQAISALATRGDARAGEVLAELLRNGPDESIRMEAARNLERFATQPRPREALRVAAAADTSTYVRLAALQSLRASADAALVPTLQTITRADKDAGVRALAAELLATAQGR